MENVVSCRLDKKEISFIKAYSEQMHESKGETLRQLLGEGRKMKAINSFKEENASLGAAAVIAGVTISEMMDLLGKYGVRSNLTAEDFQESLLNLDKER